MELCLYIAIAIWYEQNLVHACTYTSIVEQTEQTNEQTINIYEHTSLPVFSDRAWTLFQQPLQFLLLNFWLYNFRQI